MKGLTTWQFSFLRLATTTPAKGKRLGRRALDGIATIVTLDRIMRWHWQLIAQKWMHQTKRGGRPGLMKKIATLIIRMATEDSGWGYSFAIIGS